MKSSEDSLSEDLAYGPSGGRTKQWLAGAFLASLPMVYGILCLQRGHAILFGRHGTQTLSGSAGISLAIAYLSAGAFLHFHYFWGLSDRLWRFSQPLKVVSLLVFLPSFFYALYLSFF